MWLLAGLPMVPFTEFFGYFFKKGDCMAIYGFNAEWKQWIWTNIANGVTKASIFDRLIKEGYAKAIVMAELDFIPESINHPTAVPGSNNSVSPSSFYNEDNIAVTVEMLGGQRVCDSFPVFVIPGFLSVDACDFLIDVIRAKSVSSTVVDDNPINKGRISRTCHFGDIDHHHVHQLRLKIAGLIGVPVNHAEQPQGQWYEPGGFYNPHYDAFDPLKADLYKQHTEVGGQRTWTCMLNLNKPVSGGATNFPNLNIEVQPKRGQAVLWNNLDSDISPHKQSLHGGMPVEKGEKFIITQWFRQSVRG